jgi:hypothetical protein
MKTTCLAVLCLALAACGGTTFCQSQKTAVDDISKNKLTDCPTTKGFYDAVKDQMPSGQACEDIYAKCTAADKTVLDTSLTCIKALPACTAAAEGDWTTKASACSPTGVTAACTLGAH